MSERVLIISNAEDFIGHMKNVGENNTYDVKCISPEEKTQILNQIVSAFGPQGPTLIVIDSKLGNTDTEILDKFNSINIEEVAKAIQSDELIPVSITLHKKIELLRIKENWSKCLIFYFADNMTFKLIELLRSLRVDRVMNSRLPEAAEIANIVSFRRNVNEVATTNHTHVLVAENHVDTFLLVEALLMEFCTVTLAVDDRGGNLRSCEKLFPASVLREFRITNYDAVIVDLALAPEQELLAEGGNSARTDCTCVSEIVVMQNTIARHLDGLVTLSMIRDENKQIPVCVLSNYIERPGFLCAMRDVLGSDVFDSIAVFSKDYNGRMQMREWVARLCN